MDNATSHAVWVQSVDGACPSWLLLWGKLFLKRDGLRDKDLWGLLAEQCSSVCQVETIDKVVGWASALLQISELFYFERYV